MALGWAKTRLPVVGLQQNFLCYLRQCWQECSGGRAAGWPFTFRNNCISRFIGRSLWRKSLNANPTFQYCQRLKVSRSDVDSEFDCVFAASEFSGCEISGCAIIVVLYCLTAPAYTTSIIVWVDEKPLSHVRCGAEVPNILIVAAVLLLGIFSVERSDEGRLGRWWRRSLIWRSWW